MSNLIRWSPFEEMGLMRQQMDRMVDAFFGAGFGSGLPALDAGRAFAPSLEVYTTEDEVVVKAELPGMEPKDVEIEVTEDAVRLGGELRVEEEVRQDGYHRSERRYGRFERVVPLPERIQDAEARATFKHGVLTVRAPRAETPRKPQARRLQIEG